MRARDAGLRVLAATAFGCLVGGIGAVGGAGAIVSAEASAAHAAPLSGSGAAVPGATKEDAARAELEALVLRSRTSESLAPLARSTVLDDIARAGVERMAVLGVSSSGDLTGWLPDGVVSAVNAGVGESVQQVHAEWLESPEHRATLLGDYTHVGIAAVVENGEIWVVEVFADFPPATDGDVADTNATDGSVAGSSVAGDGAVQRGATGAGDADGSTFVDVTTGDIATGDVAGDRALPDRGGVTSGPSTAEDPISAGTDDGGAVSPTALSGTVWTADNRDRRGFVPVPRPAEASTPSLDDGLPSLPAAVLTGSLAEESASMGVRMGMMTVLLLAVLLAVPRLVRRVRGRGARGIPR